MEAGLNTIRSEEGQPSLDVKRKKKHFNKVYNWALGYLFRYKALFIAMVGCSVVASFVDIAIPKFIQYLIDSVLPGKNSGLLFLLLGLLFPIVGLVILFRTIRNRLDLMISEQSGRDLQLDTMDKLRQLGVAYYEKNAVGSTLSLFNNELKAVQRIYREYFPRIVQESIFLLITGGILISMNVKLSLLLIPCFLTYYFIGPRLEKKQSLFAADVAARRSEYSKKLYDSVSALLELRANQAESWDKDNLHSRLHSYRNTSISELWVSLLRGITRRFSTNLGAFLLFFFGAYLVQSGELTVGEFVAFMMYYFTVMNRLLNLVTATTEQRVLLYQADILYGFMNKTPEVEEPEYPITLPHIKGDIRFHNVSFQYRDGSPVLQKFNVSIRRGEKMALVGSSGSGISTVTKLLGRFYDPVEGDITIDGVSIRQLPLGLLRDSIGFVFQETYLFGTTIRENIRFGNPNATEEQIIKAAKAAYAHDFILASPNGYDTLVGERGIKLSGGQKQRIAVARMLLKDPAIIVLDEATSALDNISEREVLLALDRLLAGRTTLTIAHRLSTVKDYDSIAVMDNGTIVEQGPYNLLMKQGGHLYRIVEGSDDKE